MSTTANSDYDSSGCRESMAEAVGRFMEQLEADPTKLRGKSLMSLCREAGIPVDPEGLMQGRAAAIEALEGLKASGRINGYSIEPRRDGGPLWVFFDFQSRRYADAA